MKVFRDEQGQALVLTCLCAGALIGFMALSIDVGLLFRDKRNLQIAADAAATAAALDWLYNSSSTTAIANAKTVGTSAAATNGYSTSTGATVTINAGGNGEITTSYHNSAGYFEAIVTQPSPTAFMNYFGIGSVNVSARAVAGSADIINQACVYVLNPTNVCPAMTLQGSFTVTANKCGVAVNGACTGSNDALQFTGGGGTLTAASVSVQGNVGGQSGDSDPTPVIGVAPVSNPLQGISVPDSSSLTCTTPSGGSLTGNIGSSSATTCYSGNVTLSNVTMTGTIVFTGSVTLSGTIGTGTNGTTMVLSSGGLQESTGTTMNIVAPTSGTYEGIAILAPTTNTSTIEFDKGASGGTFTGIIDAPGAELYLHDSGGDNGGGLTINADIIVGTVMDQTATWTINSYSASNPTATPLLHVALVE